jgi:hypothetical protein
VTWTVWPAEDPEPLQGKLICYHQEQMAYVTLKGDMAHPSRTIGEENPQHVRCEQDQPDWRTIGSITREMGTTRFCK